MDTLFSTIVSVGDSPGSCDTFGDRLNCVYTVFIVAVFAFLITTKNYVGEQVSCWCPSHFTDSHCEYTNQVRVQEGQLLRSRGLCFCVDTLAVTASRNRTILGFSGMCIVSFNSFHGFT